MRGEISIKADQQILMLPGFYHRDPGVFGQLADRFSPESVTGLPPVYYFSHGRQSCAGQFLAGFLIKATLAALLLNARFELMRPQIDPGRVPYLYDHFEIQLRSVRDA